MTSAVRVLRGPARLAAAPAAVIVAVVLGYCGWPCSPASRHRAVCFARPSRGGARDAQGHESR